MIQIGTNIGTLLTCPVDGGTDDLGAIDDAALVWENGRVLWTGLRTEVPQSFRDQHVRFHDLHGRLVLPGLVDCHTHLAFGGWRAHEFGLRCQGASYQAIAQAGGGIAHTMAATRAATEEHLYNRARGFLANMLALGVTTVEAKSGYGLTVADEVKLLRVYQRLHAEGPQHLTATCLAAHIVPPEYRHDRAAYVRLVCDDLLPLVAAEGLAAFCDVFVEDGAFTTDQARAILAAGKRHGLHPKLHVDQLADGGGAALAAEVHATSADHLEYTNPDGIAAMADAGVVAVTLPLASLYLNQPPLDARPWIEAGACVAVATDFNPGSAPSYHLPLAMMLACTLNRMTPAQAVRGATVHAARALRLEDQVGNLTPGTRANFICLDASTVDHWLYHFRPNAVHAVYIDGVQRV